MSQPDARPTASPPSASAARLLRTMRWALPVMLFGFAVFIEWNEHVRIEGESITATLDPEVGLFGLIGPTAIFLTLSWVVRLVDAYVRTSDELAVTNRELESRIEQRTRHLQRATAQLEAANDELAAANVELRELDGLKSEFVSLVSHQLLAPLTNIRGALEIVEGSRDALPPETRRPLAILDREAGHLAGLVTKILDVSRLEAGHLSVSLGPVAIEPLLARAARASLGEPAAAPGWTLNVEPGLPPAWADETLLEEVVRNLLHNAMVHARGSGPVSIVGTLANGSVLVTVEDHGPGIPPEEHDRIFSSFHRLGGRDTTTEGYGLGLYFVSRLVGAMGGGISVASPIHAEPDRPGTRFTVVLPVAPDAPDAPDGTEGADAADGADGTDGKDPV